LVSIVSCGVRVAAAAFLIGLGLSAPQVLGVASADSGASSGASASAGPAKSGSGVVRRPRHSGSAPRATEMTGRKTAAAPKHPVAIRTVAPAPKRAAAAPGNQIQDFVEGAVLLIRRTLFNAAPRVKPVQITGQTSGVVTGAIRAVDPEGDAITYSLSRAPAYGTVVLAPDGTYTYTPGAGFDGTDQFTVLASDASSHIDLFNLFRGVGTRAVAHVGQAFTPPPACTTSCVTFTFTYGDSSNWWTPEARSALQEAADTLSSYLVVTSPVNVTYSVTGAGPDDLEYGSALGTGGSSYYYGDTAFSDTVVQHKILTGLDDNGASADGQLWFSFAAPWAFGGDTAADEFDFESVALHELVHTLGFLSSVQAPGSNPSTSVKRPVFDSFMVTSAGVHPISADGGWDSTYDPNIVGLGGGLYFDGPNAVAAYGGLVPLYTPADYSGSSLSHLDDFSTLAGYGGLLMGPHASWGVASRLSPVELGVLEDLGYTVVPGYTAVAL
jgi:hypothetical protein